MHSRFQPCKISCHGAGQSLAGRKADKVRKQHEATCLLQNSVASALMNRWTALLTQCCLASLCRQPLRPGLHPSLSVEGNDPLWSQLLAEAPAPPPSPAASRPSLRSSGRIQRLKKERGKKKQPPKYDIKFAHVGPIHCSVARSKNSQW